MIGVYRRLIIYILGLFILTLGIAFSIKADLGVSPVSALPYSFYLITGINIGLSTIVIYCIFIFIQMIILRKMFSILFLLQILFSVIFGFFTDLSLFLIQDLPADLNYGFKLMYLMISIVLVAIGIFLYFPANIITLPYDGILHALTLKTKLKLPQLKIICDVINVMISGAFCLIVIRDLGSVREGTLIAAIGVGYVLAILINRYSSKVRAFLYKSENSLPLTSTRNKMIDEGG